MAVINVFLADLPRTIMWPSPIRSTLQNYFNRVLQAIGGFDSAYVQWRSQVPSLGPSDLLAYLVLDPDDSVVKALGKKPDPKKDGLTKQSSMGTGSEVYFDRMQEEPRLIANLIFHEFMHNISGLDDAGLHNKPNISLGKETVEGGDDLSQGDINVLRPKFRAKRKQWTGGYLYYHDPFRK
jgi:hypothetical protein